MDDEDTPPVQMEQVEQQVPEAKRQRVHEQEATNLPAAKATGKPVLNTRALRSVLKGLATCSQALHAVLHRCMHRARMHASVQVPTVCARAHVP